MFTCIRTNLNQTRINIGPAYQIKLLTLIKLTIFYDARAMIFRVVNFLIFLFLKFREVFRSNRDGTYIFFQRDENRDGTKKLFFNGTGLRGGRSETLEPIVTIFPKILGMGRFSRIGELIQ